MFYSAYDSYDYISDRGVLGFFSSNGSNVNSLDIGVFWLVERSYMVTARI